jgi:molybdate/tungstate transport system ATP-binding protein
MIEIDGLSVKRGKFALHDVTLKIKDHDFLILLGPTGSGKTTLLECLAGLVGLDAGRIRIDGRDITGDKPEKRNIGIVYQDYALFPHMNVRNNILYGLRFNNERRKEQAINNYLHQLTHLLQIEDLLERYPGKLSGGEKQRVALARALIIKPSVLLLDEPLSALDDRIKNSIQTELKKIHHDLGITIILVTHNFSDAHVLAEHVGILRNGCLEQSGTVAEVFRKPHNIFVAQFVGAKNIFAVADKAGQYYLSNGYQIQPAERVESSENRYLIIRPENVFFEKDHPEVENRLTGVIVNINNYGVYQEVEILSDGLTFKSHCVANKIKLPQVGERVNFGFFASDIVFVNE